jgi:hypothetical protein
MLTAERLLEIEEALGEKVQSNAPHHARLKNFPHHKHVGRKENLQPSFETRLEEVMAVIFRGH